MLDYTAYSSTARPCKLRAPCLQGNKNCCMTAATADQLQQVLYDQSAASGWWEAVQQHRAFFGSTATSYHSILQNLTALHLALQIETQTAELVVHVLLSWKVQNLQHWPCTSARREQHALSETSFNKCSASLVPFPLSSCKLALLRGSQAAIIILTSRTGYADEL